MADQLLPSRVILRDTDAARSPLPGGTATFVATGTTTPVTILSAPGGPALANPVTADATGALPPVWYEGGAIVDCIVKRADGTTVETLARVPRYGEETTAASGISFVPAGRIAATDVQGAIEELEGEFEALGLTTAQRFATYGGTADAITLTSGSAHDALTVGMAFRFRATANNTGAATINLDGLGAIACRTVTGVALPAGYIRTTVETVAWYDGSYWVVDRLPEYGSNANGHYCRLANGWQTCTHADQVASVATATGVTGLFASGDYTWTYPQPFVSSSGLSTAAGVRSATYMWARGRTASATQGNVFVFSIGSVATATSFDVIAEGRWY